MSATFNWSIRPGVPNKYGIVINTSDDDVRPSNAVYVALFGNDNTGNGSRVLPYRTLAKCLPMGTQYVIPGSGVFREGEINTNVNTIIVGDGDVTIDFSYYFGFINANTNILNGTFLNLKFIGNNSMFSRDSPGLSATDCYFIKCCPTREYDGPGMILKNCIVDSYTGHIEIPPAVWENVTFINCNNIFIYGKVRSCIFYNSNIAFLNDYAGQAVNADYNLFYQCNIIFKSGGGYDDVLRPLYPALPTGYSYYSDTADFIAAASSYYGIASIFQHCKIADPGFNNYAIGDYTLAFDSPAKNLSYFGTYIGAKSIAQALKVKSVEADGDFDFSTAVNVTIVDDSITLTDPTQDGVIETNIIENVLGRELQAISAYGFNADRNGQYIDSIADLSDTTYAAGATLPANMPFLVEGASIVYNTNTYQPGERGTTIAAATTFSTSSGGVIREIIEAPQRHTIEMRASDVQPFTTEVWTHYDPKFAPTSNNDGDSRTGAIIRGNGDPAYVRGGSGVNEFPINAKYIKIRFTIRANNLKP